MLRFRPPPPTPQLDRARPPETVTHPVKEVVLAVKSPGCWLV